MRAERVGILVIGNTSSNEDESISSAVVTDLRQAFAHLHIDHVSAENLASGVQQQALNDYVALGVITSETEDIDAVLERCRLIPTLRETRWLLVTSRAEHDDLSRAIHEGRLAAVITVPWTVPLLLGQAYSVLVRHLHEEGMSDQDVLTLVGPPPATAVQGPLLAGLNLPEDLVMRQLLEAVEDVIGPRPRIRVPAGIDLTRQGEPVAAVHLVLDGRVSLHRDTERGELLLHHATSGPLIGLVSLACGENAFFTSTTTQDTTVVRLSNEQIQLVLVAQPSAAATLAVLAIQSLTRRLMRAEDLHVEKDLLAADLEAERAKLATTLSHLRAARAELVDKTRFAMLGELSAGIAHELNNPVTALVRAAEHLGDDVDRLLASLSGAAPVLAAVRRTLNAPPRSTAVERQLITDLIPAVGGDRAMARRLVRAGVTSREEAAALRRGEPSDIVGVEMGARIGSSLRSVVAAAQRVIALTASLKGYARPDAEEVTDVDVALGIEDVLRLTGHRLRGIHVETDFRPCPPVMAHPGKLEQVWTNVLINAAEALEDEAEDCAASGVLPARGLEVQPTIVVRVVPSGDEAVIVEICDNGPGIPEDLMKRIFEPHFTTKAGRVRYGLGLGMSICRSIIEDLGGDLTVESQPGQTRICVRLPRGAEARRVSSETRTSGGESEEKVGGLAESTQSYETKRGLPPSTTAGVSIEVKEELR